MQDGDKKSPESDQASQSAVVTTAAADATPQEPAPQWQFDPDTAQTDTSQGADNEAVAAVSWTASEFIAHDKAPSWYAGLALCGVLLAATVFLLTRDWISTVVIVIITVVFGVFASRQPRVLNYALDQVGVHIANKFYPYADFKSFSLMDEGGINAIWLMPLKRFMPSITIFYAPPDEDNIMNVLSRYLPFEQRDHDMVERLMRKVRF